jgi:hypothetical protein
MEAELTKLTVCFDGQFWIGVFEVAIGTELSVCRYVFGAEPKDSDVYDLILKKWGRLKFSPAVEADKTACDIRNPKVRQRSIREELRCKGVGTKAQQAVKLQIEQSKFERKKRKKEQREIDRQLKFDLKQKQRKEKHKGH